MMTDEIKKRIELIKSGKTPNGYRKDVVFIPLEWEFKALKKIARRIKEKAGNKELETLSISAGIGFVNQASKFGKELSGAQYVNYTVLNKGDFSYNKGNSKKYPQGCVYMLKDRDVAAVPNVFNSFRLNEKICNSSYYANLFTNGYLNKQLYKFINSGVRNDGLLNLYDDDFYNCLLPVPPIEEQENIAEILAHCDQLIELKKQLISAERDQKKWLMQNLLNPDSGVRLEGFEDQWKDSAIKEIAFVISGGTPDTNISDYWNGSILWCTPTDITSSGKYISKTQQRITAQGLKTSSATLLPVGSILMCSRATIGSKAIATQPITTNQGFKSFVCKESLNNEFFYYYLEMILNDFLRLASGNTFKELSKASVENFIVKIPTLDEQIEIANILSTADRKIELLEQEMEQWELKKKSLMQLLLTGIVRV